MEKLVIRASVSMVGCWHDTTRRLAIGEAWSAISGPNAGENGEFFGLLAEYMSALAEWGRVDWPQLPEKLKDALRALEEAERDLEDGPEGDEELIRLRQQQMLFRKHPSDLQTSRDGGGASNSTSREQVAQQGRPRGCLLGERRVCHNLDIAGLRCTVDV